MPPTSTGRNLSPSRSYAKGTPTGLPASRSWGGSSTRSHSISNCLPGDSPKSVPPSTPSLPHSGVPPPNAGALSAATFVVLRRRCPEGPACSPSYNKPSLTPPAASPSRRRHMRNSTTGDCYWRVWRRDRPTSARSFLTHPHGMATTMPPATVWAASFLIPTAPLSCGGIVYPTTSRRTSSRLTTPAVASPSTTSNWPPTLDSWSSPALGCRPSRSSTMPPTTPPRPVGSRAAVFRAGASPRLSCADALGCYGNTAFFRRCPTCPAKRTKWPMTPPASGTSLTTPCLPILIVHTRRRNLGGC
jgi:hypothetical protein